MSILKRMNAARAAAVTCSASRHAATIADHLIRRGTCGLLLAADPANCGESIAATVAALWEARAEIERLVRLADIDAALTTADVHTCNTACRKTPACAAWADLHEENERLRATNKNARDAIQAGIAINVELQAEIERLCAQVAALQARVDALMLEFCPDEMTEEQLENWARHQRPARRDGR